MEMNHHYGWTKFEGTPYEHVRATHTFLTDDNHTWEDTGESIVIRKNENSPEDHLLTPSWARDMGFWFACDYR